MADVTGNGPGLRERKKLRTRARLIDAAVELCYRQGFERTTVEQIAAIADVSPRTYSRYFATKDAVVLAFLDGVIDIIAVELARQPADISHLDALYRAHVATFNNTKTAPTNGLTAERVVASARIITSSPALMKVASEFRMDAVNAALAKRMGVVPDDRRLQLVGAVWGAIIITTLSRVGPATDWERVTVDHIVSGLEATYAQFIDSVANIRQPV